MATAVAINNYCRETPDKCVTTNDDSSSLRKRNNQQNISKRYIIYVLVITRPGGLYLIYKHGARGQCLSSDTAQLGML